MLSFRILLTAALALASPLQLVEAAPARTTRELPATNAEFPGGPKALHTYLTSVAYPEAARAAQAEGRVFVHFEISPEGKAEKIAAVLPLDENTRRKSRSTAAPAPAPNPELVRAAEALIAAMPAWKPATEKGKPVLSTQTVPVDFRLAPLPVVPAPVYAYAEQMPVFANSTPKIPFPGSLYRDIRYPPEALRGGIQGQVLVYFVVNEQGQVEQAEVIRAVHPALDNEALRVVRLQQAVSPALLEGQPVKVFYTLPVNFAVR